MKLETSKTPVGKTTIATREDEDLLVVEDRSGAELERIDIDFKEHEIRVYSNKPWPVGSFLRNGTPINTDNPLVAITMCFKDGAVLRQGFKIPVSQAKAMSSLGRFVADVGAELDIDIG